MVSDLGRDVVRDVNRHRQHAQVSVPSERPGVGPILAVQYADFVVRLAEPGGEEAAHLAAPANDEHLGPGTNATAPERVQLTHA